jgi:hypothetical protein
MSVGFSHVAALLAGVIAGFYLPAGQAATNGQAEAAQAGESPGNPLDVIFPFELQAAAYRSLPIAGLIVTPDDLAQLVLTNPRLRATTNRSSSGKGTAFPIETSGVVLVRADPPPD